MALVADGALLPAVSVAVPAGMVIPSVPAPVVELMVTVRVFPVPVTVATTPFAESVLFRVIFPMASVLAKKFVSV